MHRYNPKSSYHKNIRPAFMLLMRPVLVTFDLYHRIATLNLVTIACLVNSYIYHFIYIFISRLLRLKGYCLYTIHLLAQLYN